jgi:hypothetical protein
MAKTIQPVLIWENGQNLEAKILNAYAVHVSLGTSATFYYSLMTDNENGSLGIQVRQGNLSMTGEAYAKWELDSYAWDWVASELNLTITGDYVSPLILQSTVDSTPIFEETVAEEAPIEETSEENTEE